MRNIKLTLEYDGSRYQGWSRLGKGESTNTISNKIIEVIEKMTNEDVELYCGSRTETGVHAYAQGWSRLGKGESTNTISNKIIEVIEKMTNEDVELYCGSRTETGVHAYAQVVNFKTTTDLQLYEIKQYMNRYLPMDIAVTEIEEKPERFHASLQA